jgi:hypothetical protein
LARVEPAALEEVAAAAAEEVEEPVKVPEEADLEVAGAVAEGDEAGAVVEAAALLAEEDPAAGLVLPGALDPEAAEEVPDPLPTQLVEDPALIVKAADWAVAPVLSRRVSPMEVPEAISVVHVNEVPVCWPRFSRAAAPGWFPGRMDKK